MKNDSFYKNIKIFIVLLGMIGVLIGITAGVYLTQTTTLDKTEANAEEVFNPIVSVSDSVGLVLVAFNHPDVQAGDWIGIFPEENDMEPLDWKFLNNTYEDYSEVITEGVINLEVPEPGLYLIRYFNPDGQYYETTALIE